MHEAKTPASEGPSRSRAPRRKTGPVSIQTLRFLIEVLGSGVVAVITNHDVESVSRWAAAREPIGHHEERRLLEAVDVVDLLLASDSPSVVRAWFMGTNPLLDDRNPAELLAAGRIREVLAAADRYSDGR